MGTGYRVEPDRGFAWVVLASSLLNLMFSFGVAINGCSVYVAAMIASYGCSRAEAYVAGALSSGLFFCSAPVASVFIDKAGLRAAAVVGAVVTTMGLVLSANVPTLVYHYITFSITAIGCGFMQQSALVVPVHYFVKRRAQASSLLFAASGVNMMVFPIIVRLIIDAYSWRPSFYIIAAIVLETCVLSMLIRPSSLVKNKGIELRPKIYNDHVIEVAEPGSDVTEPGLNCDERNEQTIRFTSPETFTDSCPQTTYDAQIKNVSSEFVTTRQMFPGLAPNPLFWLLVGSCFLFEFALLSIMIIMPDMYEVGGMNVWQTSVLFISWGCANTVGRALSGFVWLKLASPLVVYCLANLFWAATLLLFLGNKNFLFLVFANVLTALGHGSFMTCFSMVTADLVGIKSANRALGYSLFAGGIGAILAPPIFGKLYDATRSHTWSVLLAAMAGFACFADGVLMLFLRRKQTRHCEKRSSSTI